jgi:hypothetical protein
MIGLSLLDRCIEITSRDLTLDVGKSALSTGKDDKDWPK